MQSNDTAIPPNTARSQSRCADASPVAPACAPW